LLLEGVQHKTDQPVFIRGDVHSSDIITEKVDALSHQVLRGSYATGYNRLINFRLSAEVIHKSALVFANDSATVFDRDFLLRNKASYKSCNINLTPPIRDCTVSTLHIAHRSTEHLGVLQFEPLTDLVQCILIVGTKTCEGNGLAVSS